MHAVRSKQRRRERERIAADIQSLNTHSNADNIAAQLEPAMAELDEAERGALVLRFLEERNLKDVGVELGITEDAARMRVNRAIERLREIFARRGKAISTAALAGALAAVAVETAPAGLAGTVLAIGSQSTLTTVAIMSWINAKSVTAIVVAAIIAGATGYLTEKQKADRLQAQVAESLAQLEKEKAGNARGADGPGGARAGGATLAIRRIRACQNAQRNCAIAPAGEFRPDGPIRPGAPFRPVGRDGGGVSPGDLRRARCSGLRRVWVARGDDPNTGVGGGFGPNQPRSIRRPGQPSASRTTGGGVGPRIADGGSGLQWNDNYGGKDIGRRPC